MFGSSFNHAGIEFLYNLYYKRARPTKNEPLQGISYLEREREGCDREREEVTERWAGGSVGRIFKVRFGRKRERG
jgi:hypothetical protein